MKINHDIVRKSNLSQNLRRWKNQRSFLGFVRNRFLWHVLPRFYYVPEFPYHVDIELSRKCNLKCPMCFREHREIPDQNNMDIDMFKGIVDEIEGKVYSIKFTGRGEPQMNKNFIEFMGYLKGKKFGEVSMITNGQLMTEDKMRAIIDCGMDFVIFSIDGLKDNYESIRAPGKYVDIVETITQLHALRAKMGSKKPLIRIQSVMIPEEEQREFLKIWEPISDDILFLYFKDYSKDAVNVQKEKYACPLPVQRMMIHYNGTSPMCINDEYEDVVIGNLKERSVREIWQGDNFTQVRKTHL